MKTPILSLVAILQAFILVSICVHQHASSVPPRGAVGASPLAAKAVTVTSRSEMLARLTDFEAKIGTTNEGQPTAQPVAKKSKRPIKKIATSIKLEQRLSSSEFLKVEWNRRRMETWRTYAAFFRENRIPVEHIPRIIDLIASANATTALATVFANATDQNDSIPFASEIDSREDLARTLGAELYGKLNAYSETIDSRHDLQIYKHMLQSMGIGYESSQDADLLEFFGKFSAKRGYAEAGDQEVEAALASVPNGQQREVLRQFLKERNLAAGR